MGSFTGRNPIRMKITRKAPFPQVGDGARLVELRGFEPLTFSLRRLGGPVRARLPLCERCTKCRALVVGGAQGVRASAKARGEPPIR
jgi:hypothetical protein